MADWNPTWTDFGGFSLPTIRASDLGYYDTTFGGEQPIMGDYNGPVTDPVTIRNYQLNGDVYGGLAGDSRNAFNSWSNNYAVSGVDDNTFDVKVKSADKEGTTVRYVRDGDYWVPQQNLGTQEWNTNRMEPMDWVMAVGGALGAPALGYALTGSLAGGALGGAAGGAEAGSGALAGLGGIEPISYSGFTAAEGGIGSLGAGWGLPGGVVAGEAGGGILGLSNMAGIGTGASAGMEALNAYNALNGAPPAGPGADPYGPPATEPYGPPVPPSDPNYLRNIGNWVLENPRLAAAGIGAVGSLLEGGGDDPTGGAGGSGGGAGGDGWNGPVSQMRAIQTRHEPPAGYRPGFSPEHVYINTTYGPGAPQDTTSGIAGIAPRPDIPPMVPRFADGGYVGPASIDPESAFTRPSPWGMPAGIQALLQRPNAYPRFAGAAGGPQYSAPQSTGIQAMFDQLNTPTNAAPRLTTRDNSRLTELANWSQTGHNPTRMNNRVAATRAAPRVFNGGTRAGYGGYGIQQFADGGYIQGPGTETSDSIPATIDGNEPAALSKNEFVLPAWLVRKIGNGSPEAGAQRLYAMMEQAKLSTNPDALLSQLA